MYTYIYIYTYVCVCVCMYVYIYIYIYHMLVSCITQTPLGKSLLTYHMPYDAMSCRIMPHAAYTIAGTVRGNRACCAIRSYRIVAVGCPMYEV